MDSGVTALGSSIIIVAIHSVHIEFLLCSNLEN